MLFCLIIAVVPVLIVGWWLLGKLDTEITGLD
jgi:hypothetical protein